MGASWARASFAVLAVVGCANAVELSLGVRSGLNLGTWYGAHDFTYTYGGETYTARVDDDRTPKPGIDVDAVLSLRFKRWLALQTGLGYTMKGYRRSGPVEFMGTRIEYTEVLNISYLEVPLLVKVVAAADLGDIGFYAGAAYDVRVGVDGYYRASSADEEPETEDMSRETKNDLDHMLSRHDLGIAGGIMFEAGRGPVRFLIDLRYTHGLLKVYDNVNRLPTYIAAAGVPDHKNLCFTLAAGVTYTFGRGAADSDRARGD